MCSWGGILLGDGVAGQSEIDVVEIGRVYGQRFDFDVFPFEPVEHCPQGPDVPGGRDLQSERVVVAYYVSKDAGGVRQPGAIGELEPDVAARNAPFELIGGALGDKLSAVEDSDPVGELVGLLEVLRREEDRDPARGEVADDLPHHSPAAW